MPRRGKRRNREPSIVVTGECDNGRHLVRIDGASVWLTGAQFEALCALAHARLATASGLVVLPKMTVRRLRAAIDDGTSRSGLGDVLIHSASKHHYKLTAARENVAHDASFRDLTAPRFAQLRLMTRIARRRTK